MQMPAEVHAALVKVGLTPDNWRRVRAAFAAVPDEASRQAETFAEWSNDISALWVALKLVRDAGSASDLPLDGSLSFDDLVDALFVLMYKAWGDSGQKAFCERFKMGKTTLYRYLHRLNIPLEREVKARKGKLLTAAEIESEIERLQQQLAELKGRAA